MINKRRMGGIALAGLIVLAGGGIAIAQQDRGPGGPEAADTNKDGFISRDEWLKAANARFDAMDRNKDGKLAIGEVPPPPMHGFRGPGHHHGPGGPGGDWHDGPPPPPPGNGAAPQ